MYNDKLNGGGGVPLPNCVKNHPNDIMHYAALLWCLLIANTMSYDIMNRSPDNCLIKQAVPCELYHHVLYGSLSHKVAHKHN